MVEQVIDGRSPCMNCTLVGSTEFYFSTNETEKDGIVQKSFFNLISLSSSKAVAQFSLREKGVGEQLLRLYMEKLASCSRHSSPVLANLE
jgi:hypothetical protein